MLSLVGASRAGTGDTTMICFPCAKGRSFRIAVCTAVGIFSVGANPVSALAYKYDLYSVGMVCPSLYIMYVYPEEIGAILKTRLVLLSLVCKYLILACLFGEHAECLCVSLSNVSEKTWEL